jgi:hypothetical protein
MAQMAGGMAKGLALLTLDEDYIRRFRSRPMGYKQRFLDGLQAAGVGVYEGVVGINFRHYDGLLSVLLPRLTSLFG